MYKVWFGLAFVKFSFCCLLQLFVMIFSSSGNIFRFNFVGILNIFILRFSSINKEIRLGYFNINLPVTTKRLLKDGL